MIRYLAVVLVPLIATLAIPATVPTVSVSGCGTAAIAKAEAADRAKLGNNADCFARAKAIAAAAEAVRRDRIASLPTPGPIFVPTPTISPSLEGVPTIASGLKIADYLEPSWQSGVIPTTAAPDVFGAFRFLCAPSHVSYDDPIVYPGQPGKSHLHQFFGNTKADGNSTYASLRTTGESTCNNLLNRSAYWIAAMVRPDGKVVQPDYVSIYYKRLPTRSPACKTMGKACVPLPRGLRYIFGYNMQNPGKGPPADYTWSCDAPNAPPGPFRNIPQAAKSCPVGGRIGVRLAAPSCWNGKDLDSPDHRSHMAYTSYGDWGYQRCPATHPYVVPQFELAAWYTTDATLDRSGDESPDAKTWYLSSDRMPGMPNAVPGTTIHTDWFGAWEDGVMDLWMQNCIDKLLSCTGGDLGNGTQIKTTAGYDYPHGRPLLDVPAQ